MTPGRTTPEGESGQAVYLFETTTFVFWAEEVAQEAGIPVDVIPAPPPRGDLCGTALQTLRQSAPSFEQVLQEAGIPFQRGESPIPAEVAREDQLEEE